MPPRLETAHPPVVDLVTGHFDMGPGYSAYRSRGTDDYLLIATLAGLGRFGHETGEIIASPGELVLLRPRTLHDYGVERTQLHWELLWTHFRPRGEWLALLNWPEEAPGLMRIALEPNSDDWRQIIERFFDAHRYATGSLRRRTLFAMNALEDVLLRIDAHNPRGQSSLDPRIQSAMEYLCRNLDRRLSVHDVANACGLSASRLSHLFREQADTTPQKFLEAQRIDRAKQLLRYSTLSIKQIAVAVGFDSPFYFTLRFKKHTGQSPRTFRRQFGGS